MSRVGVSSGILRRENVLRAGNVPLCFRSVFYHTWTSIRAMKRNRESPLSEKNIKTDTKS